jgi:hypothetical protein
MRSAATGPLRFWQDEAQNCSWGKLNYFSDVLQDIVDLRSFRRAYVQQTLAPRVLEIPSFANAVNNSTGSLCPYMR